MDCYEQLKQVVDLTNLPDLKLNQKSMVDVSAISFNYFCSSLSCCHFS